MYKVSNLDCDEEDLTARKKISWLVIFYSLPEALLIVIGPQIVVMQIGQNVKVNIFITSTMNRRKKDDSWLVTSDKVWITNTEEHLRATSVISSNRSFISMTPRATTCLGRDNAIFSSKILSTPGHVGAQNLGAGNCQYRREVQSSGVHVSKTNVGFLALTLHWHFTNFSGLDIWKNCTNSGILEWSTWVNYEKLSNRQITLNPTGSYMRKPGEKFDQ